MGNAMTHQPVLHRIRDSPDARTFKGAGATEPSDAIDAVVVGALMSFYRGPAGPQNSFSTLK